MKGSLRTMLLGIALMIFGVYIQGEPGIKWNGNEFVLVLFGFLICLAGFFLDNSKKDTNGK